MHAIDFIIIAILLVCVILAVRHLRHNGSCGCNCNCNCSRDNCHCSSADTTKQV